MRMTPSRNGNSNLEIAQSNTELIINKQNTKKRRIWILFGVATVIVLAVIIIAVVILTLPTTMPLPETTAALSLENILEGKLNPRGFNATWISGDRLLYKDEDGSIITYDVTTQETETLLTSDAPILATAFDYKLSPDEKYLLIAHDYQKIYRHSYLAQYTILNIETQAITPLVDAKGETILQLAIWGPTNNSIIFITKNNIFFRPSASAPAVSTITSDGIIGNIYNGIPDWVYEEEVFSSNRALWVSPDGSKLAYAKFDDRTTSVMTIPVYGEPGNLIFQYTKAVQIRYPKPGTTNPSESLHVVDLTNTTTLVVNLKAPNSLLQKQPILTAVSWATNDTVCAIWMSRVQNEAAIVTYETKEPFTTIVVQSLFEPSGWLEQFTPPIFSADGSKFLIILSHEQNNNTGAFRHVTMLKRQENAIPEPLTSGPFVVGDILNWDEKNDLIYFEANSEDNPAAQHIYSVSTKKEVKCLTCNIKTTSNSDCLYNSVEFSKDCSHYVLTCGGPNVPEISLHDKTNARLEVWDDNEEIKELLQEKLVPTIKRMTFEVADGFKAQVLLKLPPNLDTSGNTKYPMLVNVYGGPDSYQVVEKFNLDWGSYLAANKSIIYVLIDGRGSGMKGDKLLFSGYKRLGTVEVVDQINVTRQIQDALPYVDATRSAIWGWSYGGYASGMALATDTNSIFKCGISVAPVTDWALYDSIYTERFMGLPTTADNLEGYLNAQLVNKFEGLRDKQYFLVHGTLDDNVHYQQSMLWAKVLEHHDILFRQQSYPDEDHGLGSVRPHLYHSLENFLDECFIETIDK